MSTFNPAKKSVVCPVCSKSLSSKQNLRQHMNIHTGEKPFQCSFPGCTSSYKHASQLSNHRVLHQQHTRVATNSFDDLLSFIHLLIQALEPASEPKIDPSRNQAKEKKIDLPCILSPQVDVKLPKFEETFQLL